MNTEVFILGCDAVYSHAVNIVSEELSLLSSGYNSKQYRFYSFRTLVTTYKITRPLNAQDHNPHVQRCENFKSVMSAPV
jgi:hypothetical protein